jgi:Predicted endonuclease distantly related to archaeal Holliday junction resolvase and Mrr-like restriction enzymes
MNIFEQIGDVIFYITLIITILGCLNFISLTNKLVKSINYSKNNLRRWKQGQINLDDIHSLTPREFEFWCGEFLSNIGYYKIEQSLMGPDGGKDIICFFNGEKTYVECKRYIYSESAKYIVDIQICKKLVGAMVHDEVVRGIVITSGVIKKGCKEYIESLPKRYKVEIYDGDRIVKEYIKLHNRQKNRIA